MSIVRVKKDTKYFTASNEPFNDVRLSWETRGLLGYLLSKPNNWQIRMENLEKAGPAGNYKLRRMLSEARQYGYVNRIRVSVENNKFDWISEVYESPSMNPNPSKAIIKAKKASGGFPTSGSATSGKLPDIVITDPAITEGDFDGEMTDHERYLYVKRLYAENISPKIVPIMDQILINFSKTFPDPLWYQKAFEIYVSNNAGSWTYIEKICENWQAHGFGSPAPAVNGYGKAMNGSQAAKILQGSGG